MRKITIAVLALASTPALADVDFFVGPRSLASNPAAEDLLGYAVAAAEGPAGSRIAVVGALAGFAAIGTMLPGEDQFILGQQLSSGVSGDVFGLAVAIGGPDGSVIAVGAPEDDTFFLNSGKVYLYRRASPGGSFTLQTSIDPPMPVNVGNFGTSVALSADGTRLVVGEPKAQQSMVERGAVHIYDISGAIGAPQTLADGITVGGRFGQSVALDNNRLVVGAPTTDDAMMVDQTGALMAYQDVGGTFVADGAPLFAADRATGDRLGLAVAING
ncbi:MAG: hypothetical protein KDI71_08320, partial [Xanthomonadales bacterium]|nr:hypothetical protein [Xanthomonadales bacterium]